jgi:murein DD-endopeptidase MepM/ murein hydrolase activator NlpD
MGRKRHKDVSEKRHESDKASLTEETGSSAEAGKTDKKCDMTDMTLSSIRVTGGSQLASKLVHYGVPAAALLAFAVLLNNASLIESKISGMSASRNVTPAAGVLSEEVTETPVTEIPETVTRVVTLTSSDSKNGTEAVGIFIDGKLAGCVKDGAELKAKLDSRLEQIKKEPGVIDAEYKNSIEFIKDFYPDEKISDTDSVMEYLTAETPEVTYTGVEGDSLYWIAEDHGITIGDLLDMNPELAEDPDVFSAGTVVTIARKSQNLPVIVTKETEEKTVVPYDTKIIDSEFLERGESELIREGVNGESISRFRVKYDGDTETERELVSVEVIEPPVDEEIAVGIMLAQTEAAPAYEDTVLKGTGKFMWPVDGGEISDVFISDRNHKGLDIAAPTGTGIYAAADGKVIAAGWNTGGYGYFVMIDHGDGFATLYAHMSRVIAKNGTEIKRGELIGEIGTTGDSTGPHLHFEVREKNICRDPAAYLRVNADDPEDDSDTENEEEINEEENEEVYD